MNSLAILPTRTYPNDALHATSLRLVRGPMGGQIQEKNTGNEDERDLNERRR